MNKTLRSMRMGCSYIAITKGKEPSRTGEGRAADWHFLSRHGLAIFSVPPPCLRVFILIQALLARGKATGLSNICQLQPIRFHLCKVFCIIVEEVDKLEVGPHAPHG